jgi:hypothetical protein
VHNMARSIDNPQPVVYYLDACLRPYNLSSRNSSKRVAIKFASVSGRRHLPFLYHMATPSVFALRLYLLSASSRKVSLGFKQYYR